MVKVVSAGRFGIYVYAEGGQPHHLPHCHVRWSDGDSQVALPNLRLLAGDELPPAAKALLAEQVEALRSAWNRLNPGWQIE